MYIRNLTPHSVTVAGITIEPSGIVARVSAATADAGSVDFNGTTIPLTTTVYGKRLASKSENTVEFVENTIVSHNKQELDVVASGMEAMGLSVETGYYDPDDESSVDVPKQLIGFHYVVLKKNA